MLKTPHLLIRCFLPALLAVSMSAQEDVARSQKGLQIAPVQLNTAGKDLFLVGLGSYLVNAAGGCNDCHTNPSYTPTGDPFKGLIRVVNAAGYLAGGQQFGPFT